MVTTDATPFVGRATELAAIRRAFLGGRRLVTLRGPAGVGKTRLAQRYASFQADAVFVDAAEARDADALGSAVQAALGVEAEAIDGLASAGAVLVVLDNLEQVVDVAAEELVRWRAAAPDVRFLVTSRTRLRLPDEQVIPIDPLGCDDPRSDAVRLFAARARTVSGRDLLEEDPDAVVALAGRLDGLPLALELAAGRTTVLGPREILERLDASLSLLHSDTRGLPDRQATLEAAIAWSWDLLEEEERGALARCAVFAGEFDLDAAEAVLGADAAESLHRLCDDSLVHVAPDGTGGVRYRLYVAVRAFARARLAELPDVDAVYDAHAAYYGGDDVLERTLAWTARYRHHLFDVVKRYGGEDRQDARSWVLAASVALSRVPHLAGTLSDQIHRLRRAVSRADGCATTLQVHARLTLARLTQEDDLSEALALAEGDPALVTAVLVTRASLHLATGDRASALVDAEQARLARPREPDVARELARVLVLVDRGSAAREVLRALVVEDDDVRGAVHADLARVALVAGNLDEAAARCSDALDLLEGPESVPARADAERTLAVLHQLADDPVRARAAAQRALACSGWRRGLAHALLGALGDQSAWAAAHRAIGPTAPVEARHALARWSALRDGNDAPTEHARTVEGLLADLLRRHLRGEEGPIGIVVGPEAKWIDVPGSERVDLSRRGAMRRILDALTERRVTGGAPIDTDDLFEIGWPGEKIRGDSAAHRVRVAVSSLRTLGLGDALEKTDEGYYLSTDAPISRGAAKQKHFIDSHKVATGLFVVAMMALYDRWDSPTMWAYLATHGTYGLMWGFKSRVFPDRQWEQATSLAYGLVIWGGLSLYWLTPWLIASQGVEAPPWWMAGCFATFAFGVLLHFGADLQKHAHLAAGAGLLTDGVWARTRNPNYLGELLIYGGFGALAWRWAFVPALVLALFLAVVWLPNMRRKDASLSRYPGFAAWKARSGLLFPRVGQRT